MNETDYNTPNLNEIKKKYPSLKYLIDNSMDDRKMYTNNSLGWIRKNGLMKNMEGNEYIPIKDNINLNMALMILLYQYSTQDEIIIFSPRQSGRRIVLENIAAFNILSYEEPVHICSGKEDFDKYVVENIKNIINIISPDHRLNLDNWITYGMENINDVLNKVHDNENDIYDYENLLILMPDFAFENPDAKISKYEFIEKVRSNFCKYQILGCSTYGDIKTNERAKFVYEEIKNYNIISSKKLLDKSMNQFVNNLRKFERKEKPNTNIFDERIYVDISYKDIYFPLINANKYYKYMKTLLQNNKVMINTELCINWNE